MKSFSFYLSGALASQLIQLELPSPAENPHADWHNGPHGDIRLTEWQEEKLKKLGYDTSTYTVDHTVVLQKGLKAEGTFNKWGELNSEGKIIVPYYLDPTVTESLRQLVHDELADFTYSLGCIEMVYDPGLTHDHGVYVFGETSSGDGCWSYVGECHNCGGTDYPSMKDGWQALRLPDWCIDGAGGVHHEFLHAMGLLHEQDRPDFEEHFEVDGGGGSMTEEGWFDTGHVLEPSSNLMYSGFTLKNGRSYSSHDLLTTTDAIQVWKQYCESNFPQFPLPEMSTCPSPDVVDAIRPVFHHRFCDGDNNCLGGEDEGSEIVRCESDLNSAGCCVSVQMSLFGVYCPENGIVNGKMSYLCPNGHELRWEDWNGWVHAASVGSGSGYSWSGHSPEDNPGVCVHEDLSDPNFVWSSGYNQVIKCSMNGEMTVLPCANSNCNFNVANCVNNADESGYTCECKDEFPNCDGETTTTAAPTTTTAPSCDVTQQGTGIITSPGFPIAYGDNEACTYTLIADAGKTIRITLDSFSVEYCSPSCSCDALTINGNRHCGDGFGNGTDGFPPMQTIDIDQETAILTWDTDYSVTLQGFHFSWESVGDDVSTTEPPSTTEAPSCSVSQQGSGAITSPGFPNYYGDNESCTYILTADAGKTIRITFDSFSVEDCSSSCSCDALTINGNRHCGSGFGAGTDGSTPMQTIDIDEETAVLTWDTDGSVTRQGFNFSWESVGDDVTTTEPPSTTEAPSCDATQQGSGTITSPGFPNNYGVDESCTYTLIADAGKTIRIIFDSFSVEYCSSTPCACDALTINGYRHCGDGFGSGTNGSAPMQTTELGNYAVLTWDTDGSLSGQGFSLSWESVGDDVSTTGPTTEPPSTTEAPSCDVTQYASGTMSSPGWPEGYGNNEICTYTLIAEAGKIINITFDSFSVEDASSCQYDALEILGQKYCGNLSDSDNGPPRTMVLNFESLEIVWTSDYMITLQGWSFTWESVDSEFDPRTSVIPTGLRGCTRGENYPADILQAIGDKKEATKKVDQDEPLQIIGGVTAEANQWPWIVRLRILDSDGNAGRCGGTVVDNNWVLSAAHCCDGADEIYATFSDLTASDTSEANEYTLQAHHFVNHPLYTGVGYDLCLIHFAEDIIAADADGDVEAACVSETHPDHGSACWIAGWGTDDSGYLANDLLQAGVSIMDQEYCLAKTGYDSLEEDDICAGIPDVDNDGDTDGGVDSCQGDSGGPLICDYNGRATLVGAVSRGYGCAYEGWPGLYSALSNSFEWIQETVKASHPDDPAECTETINDSSVTCGRGEMVIAVPVCALEELTIDPSELYMESESCRGEIVEGHLVFDAGAEGCMVEPNRSNDLYIYNATILNAEGAEAMNSIISRSSGLELKFSCILERRQTVSLENGINVNVNYIFVDFGFELGAFEIEMTVYDSSDFITPASVDHVFHVRDKVYIGVANKDSELSAALERCIAFPEDDPSLEYVLIDDACAVDPTTTILTSGTSPLAKFDFEAFQFSHSEAPISIECDVSICEGDDCNVCQSGTRRRRAVSNKRMEKIKATIIAQN